MSSRPVFSGFADPYEFVYPPVLLKVVSFAGMVIGLVGAVGLAAWLHGGEVTITIGLWTLLALVTVSILTLLVHEALHGIVARILGYRVSFGVVRLDRLLFAAYAGTFEQRVTRRDLAVVAVAPLLFITVGCVVGLAAGPEWLLTPLVVVLVVNTSGAAGDLYLLYYIARLPRGSLFYDLSIDEMLVYEPAGDTPQSSS